MKNQDGHWVYCRLFRAAERSTGSFPLVFGVETVLWPTVAKKGGKRYRGVVEAAECFQVRWHGDGGERLATPDSRGWQE